MYEFIEKARKDLGNTQAGWVTRRDAADLLGKVSAQALSVLFEFREESDVDVRRVIDDALGQASASLKGVKAKARGGYELPALAEYCAKPGSREVKPSGDGFVIEVSLKGGRSQKVHASPLTRKDGVKLVRVYTYCGKADEKGMRWALLANMKLAQGALALVEKDGEECLAIVNSFLADEVSPSEFKLSVKEIAYYGDWVEKRLTGLDDF